jgi:2-methylcitrate dehydratase PrpD
MMSSGAGAGLTRRLAALAVGWRFDGLPDDIVIRARHCLLDWMGAAIAGASEPAATILHRTLAEEAGVPAATLIGRGQRAPLRRAALVNGTSGHALDYDDSHKAMHGHPSAPVWPAALALAEARAVDGRALLEAFVAGLEIEARIGALAGESHYAKGWHSTGTIGTFGAAVAAARLLGLDAARMAQALSLAATEAAGLKALFGTMAKPLHAGRAAEAGLLAALLAARGFVAGGTALEDGQGFLATQSPSPDWSAVATKTDDLFHLRRVLFKFHAACYGTHAPIEAMRRVMRQPALVPEAIDRFVVGVPPRYLAICNIARPRTGLEAKFSLVFTCAMAALGRDTADPATFSDQLTRDPALCALAERGQAVGDPNLQGSSAMVTVTVRDGGSWAEAADVTEPIADLAAQEATLARKFRSLVAPVLGEAKADAIRDMVLGIEQLANLEGLMKICAGPAGHD